MPMDRKAYARRVKLRAYTLILAAVLFYMLGVLNPWPTDFSRGFYFSVAAGLLSGGTVFVLRRAS
jgi:hypothetical protein